MRVRDHIVLSSIGAAALTRWFGRDAVGVLAAGVLLDVDHYLWFCIHDHNLDPRAAVRQFNEPYAPRSPATRTLHSPSAALALLAMSSHRRRLRPVLAGLGLHLALDWFHESRMNRVRTEALTRDDFTCQACGARGAQVQTHLHTQPTLLPSYRSHNLTSLCGHCHAAAHGGGNGSPPWS